jgi:hypothetical protein
MGETCSTNTMGGGEESIQDYIEDLKWSDM